MPPATLREPNDDIEHAVGLISLADNIALICGAHDIEDVSGRDAKAAQIGRPKPDRDLWQAERRFQLHRGRPLDSAKDRHDALGRVIDRAKIAAIDVDRNWCRIAGKRFVDALGQERIGGNVDAGKIQQVIEQRLFGIHRGTAGDRVKLDLEFALMRAVRIARRRLLDAPHALRDGFHHRQFQHGVGDPRAHPQALGSRRAGHRRHVDDEMAFLQIR